MRKYGPQIAIVFLFIFAGCTSFNTTDQEDLDYKILLEEQIEVQFNAASNTRFQQILEDYKAFKKQLYSAIRDRYNDQFREDEFYQIQKLLLGVRSERRNRLDRTVDVFHRFKGHWRGDWFQNGKMTTYVQTWFSPYKINDGLIAQKVIIRRWDNRNEEPTDEKVAINTYNQKNDMILGAVGVEQPGRKKTYAPHVGFYIDPTNLIWVACFGTDSENPSYSFFFEKVSTIDGINHYKIKGVGFNWNRKLKKIDNINWREGHYIPVKSSESTYYNYMFSR